MCGDYTVRRVMPIVRVSILTSALLLGLLFAVQPMLGEPEVGVTQSGSTISALREMANRGSYSATATPSPVIQQ